MPCPKVAKIMPIPVEVIDEQPLLLSAIIEGTIPLLIVGSHRETISFDIIYSPRHPIILGLSWLMTHNPIMDWHKQSIDFTTRIGKANSSLEAVHVIGASPVLVRHEDHHPILGTRDKSSFFDIGTEHTNTRKHKLLLRSNHQPQFLLNIGSSLMSLRNGMHIDYQSIGRTIVQSTSLTVPVLPLVPSTGYQSQSWKRIVHTSMKNWRKGSFTTQNLRLGHQSCSSRKRMAPCVYVLTTTDLTR